MNTWLSRVYRLSEINGILLTSTMLEMGILFIKKDRHFGNNILYMVLHITQTSYQETSDNENRNF